AVLADRLCDRQDVRLVEGAVLGRAPVPAGAKGDPLARVRGVGGAIVVGGPQPIDVDQGFGGGWFSGERRDGHGATVSLDGTRGKPPPVDGIPKRRAELSAAQGSAWASGVKAGAG